MSAKRERPWYLSPGEPLPITPAQRHHNLQREYQALLTYCKNHGLTVRIASDKELHDYAAMNEMAAKRIGFPIKKNEILLDNNPDLARRIRNLKHELVERNLMKEGDSYWRAHCIALQREHQKCKRMR